MKRNPFLITGYDGKDYFCDRESESSRLLNAIENSRNVTLISPRRMGKSGLIHHVLNGLNKRNFTTVYLDILATTTLTEFSSSFVKAVVLSVAHNQGYLKSVLNKLSSLKLRMSIDPTTGEPSITFVPLNRTEAELSIESILSYIKSLKTRFVIAIDEFQQIGGYPEKTTEAFLRSQIQEIPNLTIIFSGSRRHLLTEMFTSPKRPLYSSTEIIELGKIDAEPYTRFISGHFSENNKRITEEAIKRVLYETNRHTYYVQYLCNRLFSNRVVKEEDVDVFLLTITKENESVYANYLNLLTASQFRLLRAICLNRGTETPTSGDFIGLYNLGAASTVSQSLHSLVDKEFIFMDGESYMPNDPFLAEWLRRKSNM